MNITHVGEAGNGPAYEIEADRFGNYTIKVAGKVIKRVTSVANYLGKPKWGSKVLQRNAVEDAKAAIASFRTPQA